MFVMVSLLWMVRMARLSYSPAYNFAHSQLFIESHETAHSRHPPSPSATRVMLLGSGELGKEVIISSVSADSLCRMG
jgi:hypothetical protein